jgi:hypothetical protein
MAGAASGRAGKRILAVLTTRARRAAPRPSDDLGCAAGSPMMRQVRPHPRPV